MIYLLFDIKFDMLFYKSFCFHIIFTIGGGGEMGMKGGGGG